MLHPAANRHPKATHWHASSCSQQAPQGHTSMASYGSLKQSLGMLHPAANRHPKATHPWLLLGVQACRLPALKTIQTLQTLKLACFILQPTGTPRPHIGMLHPAANKHPKATHPWLLMGVQACRLPALKPSKATHPWLLWASKPAVCQPLNPLKLACFILQPTGTPRPHIGMLHLAANRHPKATHPWLLMGVQACRLPALKRSKRSKPLKSLQPLKRC